MGHDDDYGFVPANYIEIGPPETKTEEPEPSAPAPPPLPARTPSDDAQAPPLPARNSQAAPEEPSSPATSSAPNPASMIAGMMAARANASQPPPPPLDLQSSNRDADEESDSVKSPPLPARPRGDSHLSSESPRPSPRVEHHHSRSDHDSPVHHHSAPRTPGTAPLTPGDFHMYNINEMVSIMGKKKKMPTTLGLNLRTGIIMIAPEYAQDGPAQEWTADRMTHYSREGKHVFMELVKPSKSIDFHAGAKDTAEEIVSMLGEMAGAVRAEGLREVIMAATGPKTIQQKKGVVLYDFTAQGDDEVTVYIGDEVVILDDTKSDEWWMVRRVKNQREGVVPSSYIEVTGILDTPASTVTTTTGVNAGKSTVEQNRLEEERLYKEAIKASQREEQKERERSRSEVGPGLPLPDRSSSLSARKGNTEAQQRSRRENGRAEASGSSRSNGRSSKFASPPLPLVVIVRWLLWEHFLTDLVFFSFFFPLSYRARSFQDPHMDGPYQVLHRGGPVPGREGWQDQPSQAQRCPDRRAHLQDVSRRPGVRRADHRHIPRRRQAALRSQEAGIGRRGFASAVACQGRCDDRAQEARVRLVPILPELRGPAGALRAVLASFHPGVDGRERLARRRCHRAPESGLPRR